MLGEALDVAMIRQFSPVLVRLELKSLLHGLEGKATFRFCDDLAGGSAGRTVEHTKGENQYW
jgi:hypothetical protein